MKNCEVSATKVKGAANNGNSTNLNLTIPERQKLAVLHPGTVYPIV